jgi:hypothetical protein
MDQQSAGTSNAPWTTGEVASLNAYQAAGVMHSFTCGKDECRASHRDVLLATPSGWVCRHCGYRQCWAHTWMTDGSWRQPADRMAQMVAFMSATHGSDAPGGGWRR